MRKQKFGLDQEGSYEDIANVGRLPIRSYLLIQPHSPKNVETNLKVNSKLTIGHVMKHAPENGNPGLEASIIDIAQDYLFMHSVVKVAYVLFRRGRQTKVREGEAGNRSRDWPGPLSNIIME